MFQKLQEGCKKVSKRGLRLRLRWRLRLRLRLRHADTDTDTDTDADADVDAHAILSWKPSYTPLAISETHTESAQLTFQTREIHLRLNDERNS